MTPEYVEVDDATSSRLLETAQRLKLTKTQVIESFLKMVRDGDVAMEKDEMKNKAVSQESAPSSPSSMAPVLAEKVMMQEIRKIDQAENGNKEGQRMSMREIMELQMMQDMVASRNKAPAMDPMMMMMMQQQQQAQMQMMMMMTQGKGNQQDPTMMEIMRKTFEDSSKRSEDAMRTLMEKTYGDEQAKMFMAELEKMKTELAYTRQQNAEEIRRGRGEPVDPLVDGLDKAVRAKQTLEAAGMIRSESEEERKHERESRAQSSQHGKEIRQMDIVADKTTEIGGSIDRKLDTLIMLLADEQRCRMKAQGLEPTYKPSTDQEAQVSAERLERVLAEKQAARAKRLTQEQGQEEPPE